MSPDCNDVSTGCTGGSMRNSTANVTLRNLHRLAMLCAILVQKALSTLLTLRTNVQALSF